jgi:hypothetical protein
LAEEEDYLLRMKAEGGRMKRSGGSSDDAERVLRVARPSGLLVSTSCRDELPTEARTMPCARQAGWKPAPHSRSRDEEVRRRRMRRPADRRSAPSTNESRISFCLQSSESGLSSAHAS